MSILQDFQRAIFCEVLWWVRCLSVCQSVCMSVCPRGCLRNHKRDLYQILCTCCRCRGSVLLRHVDYRPHRLSGGSGWLVCTARAKCNVRLPCFQLCPMCPPFLCITQSIRFFHSLMPLACENFRHASQQIKSPTRRVAIVRSDWHESRPQRTA